MDHIQFEEDLELYALGTIEGDEKLEMEDHLRKCAQCVRKLEQARGRLGLIGFAAPGAKPPAHARDRLLHGLRKLQPVKTIKPALPVWKWLTAGLALTAVLLAIWSTNLSRRNRLLEKQVKKLSAEAQNLQTSADRARAVVDVLSSPQTVQVTLVAQPSKPAPEGKAFYHPARGLLFYAANLPMLAPGHTYQLWLIPAQGNPISAGIFSTDANGNGKIILPPLPSGVIAKAFAVTIEPAGGVPQPTGPKVLVGAAS